MIYINIGLAILLASLAPVFSLAQNIIYEEYHFNLLELFNPSFAATIYFLLTIVFYLILVMIATRASSFSCRFQGAFSGLNLLRVGIVLVLLHSVLICLASAARLGWWDVMILFYSHAITVWPGLVLILIGLLKAFGASLPAYQLEGIKR